MKTIQPCDGLKILIKLGIIILKTENIDNKGLTTTYNLVLLDKTEILVQYCPCCGKKLQDVLSVPEGECNVLIEDREYD